MLCALSGDALSLILMTRHSKKHQIADKLFVIAFTGKSIVIVRQRKQSLSHLIGSSDQISNRPLKKNQLHPTANEWRCPLLWLHYMQTNGCRSASPSSGYGKKLVLVYFVYKWFYGFVWIDTRCVCDYVRH